MQDRFLNGFDYLNGVKVSIILLIQHGAIIISCGFQPDMRTTIRTRNWLPATRASVGLPLRFHDLRHTHAAILIAQGEHPKVIQLRLGHSSIQVTLDTYGHLFEGLDEAAADRLDAAFMRTPANLSLNLGSSGVS